MTTPQSTTNLVMGSTLRLHWGSRTARVCQHGYVKDPDGHVVDGHRRVGGACEARLPGRRDRCRTVERVVGGRRRIRRCEDLVEELLSRDDGATLFVSGTVSNQGRFYPRFDAVVLLSAPVDALLRRIGTRTTNDYGKPAEERALIVRHSHGGRAVATGYVHTEIDAVQPLGAVVSQLVAIGRG